MTIPEYDKECNCELCIKERASWNSKRAKVWKKHKEQQKAGEP